VRVYCCGCGNSNGGRVGLLGLLLLLILVLLVQHAIGRFVSSPHHVVLRPVAGVLTDLHFFLFTILWLLFCPCPILLLFASIKYAVLVFLLPALIVTLLLSIACNGTELGVKLKLAIEGIESGSYCHNLFVIERFGSPSSFGFEQVKHAFG
jgi:hypothetical protein